jgi:hypothetical protein
MRLWRIRVRASQSSAREAIVENPPARVRSWPGSESIDFDGYAVHADFAGGPAASCTVLTGNIGFAGKSVPIDRSG